MTRIMRVSLLLILDFVLLFPGPCLAQNSNQSGVQTVEALKPQFQAIWLGDQCVQRKQTWASYWAWIPIFYNGKSGMQGWLSLKDQLVSTIADPSRKKRLAGELSNLGEHVGGEWAKDNACRKLRTGSTNIFESGKPSLEDMVSKLRAAAAGDNGNGSSLQQGIDAVNILVDTAVGSH